MAATKSRYGHHDGRRDVTLEDPDMSVAHALIFDSGIGGLSVSAELRKRLPHLHQSYLADDAFRPYGEKSEQSIRDRVPHLLRPVCDMLQPDIVVIACNTASTTALPAIRAALDVPIIGVVPAIKPAAEITQTGTIAVLGTPGTVRRRYVDDLITRFAGDKTVILQGSLALVEAAEAKLAGRPIDVAAIKADIAPLFDGPYGSKIDAVVLACTHFPLLIDELDMVSPQSVRWIDSGAAIARRVETVLQERPLKGQAPDQPIAFSIGGDITPARQTTFTDYGFERFIALPY